MSTALSRQCRALRQWLPEYAEEKLSGRRRAAVAEHLAGCARCTEEVAELRLTLASLHAVGQEAVPAHVLAAIRTSLRDPAAARRLPSAQPAASLWARLAVPIAAATGLVAVAFVLHQSPAPQQAAVSAPPTRTVTEEAPAHRSAPAAAGTPAAGSQAEPVAPPRAASGDRRAASPLPRDRAMGRGPVPSAAKDTLAAHAGEPEARKPEEKLRGLAGPPAPSAPELSDTVAAAAPAAPEMAPPPAQGAVGGTAGGGGGMGGGGGRGGRGGSGAKGVTPPVGQRPWRVIPPGRYARRHRRGSYPERGRTGRAPASAPDLGAAPPAAARFESQARPPANAVFVQTDRGQAIALHLEPSMGRKVKVYAGNQVIRPGGESADRVLLPAGSMGNSPAQVPITVSSEAGDWKYTLFTPGASQVGKQQSTAVRRYQSEPLSQVLADLSAQSGLVLLVEGSTDRKVEGELPLASPQDAVARLAEAAKLDAYTEDGTVYTLRPRR